MMLSRMSVEGAQFFGTTNPDNPNHWLMKDYLMRKDDLDMALFHFTLDDNPYLPKTYVEQLKKEYTGLWYKRFILGEWCVAEGAIYDFFDEKKHCTDVFPEAKYYTVGIDYGTTNPAAFILFGVNPYTTPKVWAIKEYYWDPVRESKQKTDAEFSADFQKFIAPYRTKIRSIYCDPSAESFQLQLRRDGILNLRDAENEVLDGIRTKARMLSSGEYVISPSCRNYIDEFYSYSWDEKRQLIGEDKPIKKFDHCQDCARYVIHSIFGVQEYDLMKFVEA